MNGNYAVFKITEDILFGGMKVKKCQSSRTIFLFLLLFFVHLSLYFIQSDMNYSLFSSSGNGEIPYLGKNDFPNNYPSDAGIIPSLTGSGSPRARINEIIDPKPVYTPGDEIHIRNRFEISLTDPYGNHYAFVQQVIEIYLFASSDPRTNDSSHLVWTDSTNGVPDGNAAISANLAYGWLDTTFIIPDLTTLTDMGISAGDEVVIYQFYPSGNTTSRMAGYPPFGYEDTFLLSGFAELRIVQEFTNTASGDNTFRQGGEATARIQSVTTDGDPVADVDISVTLRNKTTDNEIILPGIGITAALEDLLGNPSTTTDANGFIDLSVYSTWPITPEDSYYFEVTGDFSTTIYKTENVDNTSTVTANFIIENEWDTVTLNFVSAVPDPLNPPNSNDTIVTFQAEALYAYGAAEYYYPQNIPVNATLDAPIEGVTLTFNTGYTDNGSGWANTDSNGLIQFKISAGFPIPFQSKTPTITATADLQNTLLPNNSYPYVSPPQPHLFMRNSTEGLILTENQMISIDPDFWIGDIVFIGDNTTGGQIRPGEAAILEYEVRKDASTSFAGVPVKIELDQPISGVSLIFNPTRNTPYGSGYYRTDVSGIIEVTVDSTYLVTPEYPTISVALDLTVDFENDSNIRWIGTYHAGTDTLENFDKTWHIETSTDLTINSGFTYCDIVYLHTNESDTTIRSGDALTVTFKVQAGATGLSQVPVNVSLVGSYAGVTLSVSDSGGPDPKGRSNYELTTIDGSFTVLLTTNYGVTPKNEVIELNATADFENDTGRAEWFVGRKAENPSFLSNSSYSDVSRTITVAPQYFTGNIIVPTDANRPNATLVQQEQTIRITFQLKLTDSQGEWNPDIDGVNISIKINNTDPQNWGMNVTPAESQISIDSFVTFYIRTNYSDWWTPENVYNITATADFGLIKSSTYNFTTPYPNTVPTGYLAGVWVNGTDVTGSYSEVSAEFEVKNIDIITIEDISVLDLVHDDEGFSDGFWEVYRQTTTITLTGSYEDNTQEPVNNTPIQLLWNDSVSGPYLLTTDTTDSNGAFSIDVTLPGSTALDDITIYARDVEDLTPKEVRVGITNIRVVSTINLDDFHRTGSFKGSVVHVGENVSFSGTLKDDQGGNINSDELINRLRLTGWNGTHEIGSEDIGPSTATASYSLTIPIPANFTEDSLYVRLNITSSPTLIHYRINSTSESVNVYRDFQVYNLVVDLPINGSNDIPISNDSINFIWETGSQTITLRGVIRDLTGRNLAAKEVMYIWNGTSTPIILDTGGAFTISSPSINGWVNETLIWQLYHITDNGTTLSTHLNVTFRWEYYDTTNPTITLISPSNFETDGILFPSGTTLISVTVEDPGPVSDAVTVGLDPTSVTIWIDDNPYSMSQVGSTFSYNWDTSSPGDVTHNITITAADFAMNSYRVVYDGIVVDIIEPLATIVVTEHNQYLRVNSEGNVVISGIISDAYSDTGKDSGVDENSVGLTIIRFSDGTPIITVPNVNITINQGSYSYNWSILNPTTKVHRTLFATEEDWVITVSLEDVAGNSNETSRSVKLDNTLPTLLVVTQPKDVVIDDNIVEVELNVTFNDYQSGINLETLQFEVVSVSNQQIIRSFVFNDSEVVDLTNSNASLSYSISKESNETNDNYFIRVRISDNTVNELVTDSEIFTVFYVTHTTTTTTIPTTTTETTQGGGFGTVDLIQFLLFDLLALGGGIGLAALYERFKGMRSA